MLVTKTATVRAERLRRLSILQKHFDGLLSMTPSRSATAGSPPPWSTPDANRAAERWTSSSPPPPTPHGARLYTRNIDDFAGLERLVDIVAV